MRITKNEFIEAMKDIETQLDIDVKNHKAFSTILENDFTSNMTNVLYDTLVKLLEKFTGDTEDQYIQHYLYELDCGKENWRLKVYDKDKKEVRLTTIEDLWNILQKDKDTYPVEKVTTLPKDAWQKKQHTTKQEDI